MSDPCFPFLASVELFFGCLSQSGLKPEHLEGLRRNLAKLAKSEAPFGPDVSRALGALLDKLEPEWDYGPGRATMQLCQALLDVRQAYAKQPAQLPALVARWEREAKNVVI